MQSSFSQQENLKIARMKKDFEVCSDILDAYFQPWTVRLYRRCKSLWTKSIERKAVTRGQEIIPAVFALIVLCGILLPLAGSYSGGFKLTASVYSNDILPRLSQIPQTETEDDEDGSLININTASSDELTALPGIGPVLAQRIIDERSTHGAFHYSADLLSVPGIGEKTLARIVPFISFKTDNEQQH